MNSSSFWCCVSDQVPKILKTWSFDERLQLLRTWRFWRPGAKFLKTRSSDERLQIPRTWSSEDLRKRLILIKPQLKFKFLKVNGESTKDWQKYKRLNKFVQAVTFIPASSSARLLVYEESFSLSKRIHCYLSIYIETWRKRRKDTQELCTRTTQQHYPQTSSFVLRFKLFTSAFKKHFHCKHFYSNFFVCSSLRDQFGQYHWED